MRALIVIDVQNDFCPGGALAVPDGDQVIEPCNALIAAAPLVVLTADWHPRGHHSFASSQSLNPYDSIDMAYGPQVLWPDHCVQGTPGAAFHSKLETKKARFIIRKGMNPAIDSYSAFFENDKTTPTGLAGALRELGVTALDLAGLATDFCVAYTALDGRRLGFDVRVMAHAVRGIDLDGSVARAWEQMSEAGVTRG